MRASFYLVLSVFLLSACAGITPLDPSLSLNKTSFDELDGWLDDSHVAALGAFAKSCDRISKQDPNKAFGRNGLGGVYGDWQPACRALTEIYTNGNQENPDMARAFFEQWFDPYLARNRFETKGLFTGYYEASLFGSRTKKGPYQTPLYRRPADLVMVELGDFRDDLTGQRVAGRVNDNRLKPYETRAEIEMGALDGKGLEIVWVSDAADAFFLHIQGSGQVKLDDGSVIRVGYDGQNGHPYYAIGRELVAKGELAVEAVSLQSIKDWMKSNPDKAQELRNTNPSFIFFKELQTDAPLGAEGVPLTPHRSLAVDRKFIPMSVPIWLNVEHPLYKDNTIKTLMVAQDTGGAIVGPIRGDMFWGSGQDAEVLAGRMKSEGKYWLLLPKRMTIIE